MLVLVLLPSSSLLLKKLERKQPRSTSHPSPPSPSSSPFFLDSILPLLPCTPTCFFYLHSTFLRLTGRSREILRLTSCLYVCCTSVAASLCQDEQSAVFNTWVNTTARLLWASGGATPFRWASTRLLAGQGCCCLPHLLL